MELKRILAEGKAQGLTYDEIMPNPELAFLDFHLLITGKWEEFFPIVPSILFQLKNDVHTKFFEGPPDPTCVSLWIVKGSISGAFSVQKDQWWQYIRFWREKSDKATIEVRPRRISDDLYNLRLQDPYVVLETLTRKYGFIWKLQQVFHDIQTQGVNNSR